MEAKALDAMPLAYILDEGALTAGGWLRYLTKEIYGCR